MTKASITQHDSIAAEAATFAIRVHGPSERYPEGQKRKGTGWPYIVHPTGVAFMLRDLYPDDENLEAAGWLHDVLEDTDVTEAEMRERFGDDVTDLVVGVTNKGNWRLDDYVDDKRVLRLKAADTIDNIRDTIRGIEKGHDVWSRFAKGPGKITTWRRHSKIVAEYLYPETIAERFAEAVAHADRLRSGLSE